jgi:hypothetical protein
MTLNCSYNQLTSNSSCNSNLPTNLQTKLIAYDPQLKALVRTQKQSTTKKSKYPLGNPVDLIPNDIITATRLQDAIDAINKEPSP